MSEMAVVSSRKARLKTLSDNGNAGAKAALALVNEPGRFLSTVQIGITLIGIVAGMYSGATLAEPLGHFFSGIAFLGEHGEAVALALVVTIITYLSLVIGELVPKQLALKYAENISCMVAPFMQFLAKITVPILWFLEVSNLTLLRLLRVAGEKENTVSEDEVKAMIAEGTKTGVFEEQERRMIEGIMRLSDQSVRAIMTPRNSIIWVELLEPLESIIHKIHESRHSRFLLCEGNLENVKGFVSVKDILAQVGANQSLNLETCLQEPLIFSDKMNVFSALDRFRLSTSNLSLIIDEYGSLEGIVTLKDVLQAIIGNLPEQNPRKNAGAIQLEDGSWLIDGLCPIHETERLIGVHNMQAETDNFHTLAGFLLFKIGHVPIEGSIFKWAGFRFEVVDMDGRRVDKILVRKEQ